jgi:hypothetical protein
MTYDPAADLGVLVLFGGDGNSGALNDTYNSASLPYESDGGAIYSVGSLTVINSTFSGNSASSSITHNEGGAIFSWGSPTVINSTISGNFVTNAEEASGGGIVNDWGSLTLANSVVSGNWIGTASTISQYDDLDDTSNATAFTAANGNSGGNIVGYYNNPTLGAPTPAVNLAPLSNYGGPMPTMIPLPGSPAICAGLVAQLPTGVTTDQRGLPNTNTSYPGYSANTPCVDAGAVQTNYALAFTTQPAPIPPALTIQPRSVLRFGSLTQPPSR